MEQFCTKNKFLIDYFFDKIPYNFGKLVRNRKFSKNVSCLQATKDRGKYTLISHLLFSIKDDKI